MPLTKFVWQVQEEKGPGHYVPFFDPLDGGVRASILLLMEAPGRMAVSSCFVSRDNPDQTAANLFRLLRDAKLPRKTTAIWNTIPWYIGREDVSKIRRPVSRDLSDSWAYLERLLSLLPDLRTIVLCGGAAGRMADRLLVRTGVELLAIPHPSPTVFNRWPDKRLVAEQHLRAISTAQGVNKVSM